MGKAEPGRKRVVTSFSVSDLLILKLDEIAGSSIGRSAVAERSLWRYFGIVDRLRQQVLDEFNDREIEVLRRFYPGLKRDESIGLLNPESLEAALRMPDVKSAVPEGLIGKVRALTFTELVVLTEIIES